MDSVQDSATCVYELCAGWGKLPVGWAFSQVPGVAVDSHDNVYVFNRSEHAVIVFDRHGEFLTSWGEGVFPRPHGIRIDPEDNVYLTDVDSHLVLKFTKEGECLMTLGTEGKPKEGAPFNKPTDVAVSPSGEIYVSDGYGNSLVHRFSPSGELLGSWGSPGEGPGQFNVPHAVCVDAKGRVYVADRQNNRIQVFTPEGEFLTEWGDFILPNGLFLGSDGHIYVAEGGHRVSKLTQDGRLVLRFGQEGAAPGQFNFPHGICADPLGDLYVTEIFGERMQKFAANPRQADSRRMRGSVRHERRCR